MRTACILAVLGTSGLAAAFPPGVRAVRQGAPPGGDGLSWATAFNDLQPALAAAAADPSVTEIWVGGGTYYPAAPGGPPDASFAVNNVALYGGFGGTESQRGQRRPDLHASILSGDLNRSGTPDPGDCGPVVRVSGDSRAVLIGLQVLGGWVGSGNGGAGALLVDGTPVIADCRFSGDGNSGSATIMRIHAGPTLVLQRCWLQGHSTSIIGSTLETARPMFLRDCTLISSTAFSTFGLRFRDVVMERCSVTAGADGAMGMDADSLTARQSVFSGGSADAGVFNAITAQVTDCVLYGGGHHTHYHVGTGAFERCRFLGWNGSGGNTIYTFLGGTSITARNCLFRGGAFYNAVIDSHQAELANCTITGVSFASTAGVLHGEGGAWSITNTVIYGNSTSRVSTGIAPGSFNYSCIQGWDGSLGGVGNTGADPLLDADGRPSVGSPAIDAGTAQAAGSAFDLDGNCRVTDGDNDGVFRIDMGAYEFRQCPANFDCSTGAPLLNAADLLYFLDRFRAGDPRTNCDGSTIPPMLNVLDFNCFLSRFAAGCP